jgi:hypothetical protein
VVPGRGTLFTKAGEAESQEATAPPLAQGRQRGIVISTGFASMRLARHGNLCLSTRYA